jgi:hypothetical protein
MTAADKLARLCIELKGMTVSHIWRGYGTPFFLELGVLTPSTKTRRDGSLRNPTGQISIEVGEGWRIEDTDAIRCGSWSEEALRSSSVECFLNAAIEDVRLFGRLPEIDLTSSCGLHWVSFTLSEGQPDWAIVDRRGAVPVWFDVAGGLIRESDGRVS